MSANREMPPRDDHEPSPKTLSSDSSALVSVALGEEGAIERTYRLMREDPEWQKARREALVEQLQDRIY